MNKRATLIRAVALILLLSTVSLPIVRADPGWLAGWGKRVKISLDSGDIDEALTDFPFLIHLSSSCGINSEDLTFVFDEVGANSEKIAVTTSDGTTECYVEIEHWDSGGEEAWLWTKGPSLSNTSDTDIYLYFDNDHADNDAYVGDPGSVPAENVWDDNYLLVLHLHETGGDATTRNDSTSNDNDFVAVDITTPDAVGKIDGADDFSQANTDYHEKTTQNFNLQVFSIEAWINRDSIADYDIIIRPTTATGPSGWQFRAEQTTKHLTLMAFPVEGPPDWTSESTGTLEVDTWYYVAGTCAGNGNTAYTYIDGTQDGSVAVTTIPYGTTVARIAAAPHDVHWFDGTIDEIRISNIVRTPAWIETTYESGRDHFIDFGSEETLVTVTDTDTYTTTSCTSTTTTSTGTGTTTSTDYITTTDTISITTITSLSTATITSCETSCETCTTTCGTACLTTTITTTFTTGDLTTTTVVRTVVYDACVLDEFDDDALVAWYNNTQRNVGGFVEVADEDGMYNASSILNMTGIRDAGDITSVQVFDDGDSYNVSEVVGAPGFDIRFNFTAIPHSVDVHLNMYVLYEGLLAHDVTIDAWNYTSEAWVSLANDIDAGAVFVWVNNTYIGAFEDLVVGGIIQCRIYHSSAGNVNHDIYIDYIELRVDRCPCGQVYSVNMLEDLNATAIVRFRYNITIPPGVGCIACVQFSQDNATWVNSDGVAQWEHLTTGDNTILLTGLDWGGNFFYRAAMHKNATGFSPELDLVQVCYSTTVPVGGGNILVVIVLLLLGAVGIVMVGMKKRW